MGKSARRRRTGGRSSGHISGTAREWITRTSDTIHTSLEDSGLLTRWGWEPQTPEIQYCGTTTHTVPVTRLIALIRAAETRKRRTMDATTTKRRTGSIVTRAEEGEGGQRTANGDAMTIRA